MTLTDVILQSGGSDVLPILAAIMFAVIVGGVIYYLGNRQKEQFDQATQTQPSPPPSLSCTRCGNAVDKGTKFCHECGKNLA